jgi:hypothetical protein
MSSAATNPPPGPPTREELKAAFKAFKRRLKVIRLDAESKLSRSPMTKGADSGIVAISPPTEFRQAVWDELVKQGKLKYAGQGTYEVARE